MTTHYDATLSDFDIEVYNWMARSIRETGVPMAQAMIANKMRCARPTVRAALIELDRRGYIQFTRFKPQATVLTDPARKLTNDPAKAPPKTEMPWDG